MRAPIQEKKDFGFICFVFLFEFESWWTLVNWFFDLLSFFSFFFPFSTAITMFRIFSLLRSLETQSLNWPGRTESIASRVSQKRKRQVVDKQGNESIFLSAKAYFLWQLRKRYRTLFGCRY